MFDSLGMTAGFRNKEDAEKFHELLKRRMKHFGLNFEEEKSRLIELGGLQRKTGIKKDSKRA